MKKVFDISYKHDIIDGKVKVVTEEGRSARIVCWDMKHDLPIVALVTHEDGEEYCRVFDVEGKNVLDCDNQLYVLTEPELTEFEDKLGSILIPAWDTVNENESCEGTIDEVKTSAKKLLEIARKQILGECDTDAEKMIEKHAESIYFHSTDQEEYMVTKDIALQACKVAVHNATKDLPKWKLSGIAYLVESLPKIDYAHNHFVARCEKGTYYLDLEELYKLPKEE